MLSGHSLRPSADTGVHVPRALPWSRGGAVWERGMPPSMAAFGGPRVQYCGRPCVLQRWPCLSLEPGGFQDSGDLGERNTPFMQDRTVGQLLTLSFQTHTLSLFKDITSSQKLQGQPSSLCGAHMPSDMWVGVSLLLAYPPPWWA